MGRRGTLAVVVLVRGDVEVAAWPLVGSDRPDLSVVEALARLQLAARALGCSVRLREVDAQLSEVLDLVGLCEVLAGGAGLGGPEAGRQAEGGEQAGVEEVVMPDDPVA